MIVGYVYNKNKTSLPKFSNTTYTILESLSLSACLFYLNTSIDLHWQRCVWFTPICCFTIVIFTEGKGLISKIGKTNSLVLLANMSFIVFLSHQVLIGYCNFINKHILHLGNVHQATFTIICVMTFSYILLQVDKKLQSSLKLQHQNSNR